MPCEKAKTYRNEGAALDYFNDPRLLDCYLWWSYFLRR